MINRLFLACLLFSNNLSAQSNSNGKATSFQMLQREIFSPNCALSGCHDGSFEPDFRTTESSYNTLVFHPVVKNNLGNKFKYRVLPGKPEESVLYERLTNCCFVNQDDRMPFTVGDTLPSFKTDMVKKWIIQGAANQLGIAPVSPPAGIYFDERYQVKGNDSISMNSDTFHEDGFYANSLMINPEHRKISFQFNIRNEDPSDEQQYNLTFFSDKNYTALITEYELKKNKTDFSADVLAQDFRPNQIAFMQLKVIRKDKTYYYPNSNTPYFQKTHWSVLRRP